LENRPRIVIIIASLSLVDQEQISFKGSGQFDGCALSIVELIESSIAPGDNPADINPAWRPRHPVAHWLRSFRVRQSSCITEGIVIVWKRTGRTPTYSMSTR
jgi:hypothetical protein